MKNILLIIFLLPCFCFAQNGPSPIKLFSDSSGYVSDFQFFYRNAAGDYKLKIKKDSINFYKPIRLLSADSSSGPANLLWLDPNDKKVKIARYPTLKGTVNWTPGTVAAGSSATTTFTVTGASLGDPVTVSKASGAYSNGEVYDAFVSATNTVTVRVHNVSTGSANYSTAADYNIVLLKY